MVTAAMASAVVGIAPLQGAPAVCPGASNSVCVEQVGDRNRAVVTLAGERNGGGSLGGEASGPLAALDGGAIDAPVVVPPLSSGSISQQGNDNRAEIAVLGDDNQFVVSQAGDGNLATQYLVGDRNRSAILQSGSSNVSTELQIGSDNRSYVLQSGDGNVATTQQVPGPELALLGGDPASVPAGLLAAFASGAGGTSTSNVLLLEQKNGGNVADLLQAGSGDSIALRQDGNATISIAQLGAGKSISVEQSAGSQGIRITQH